MSVYAEVIDAMKARDATIENILVKLDAVYRRTTDSDLRTFLFEVRAVLNSKLLERSMPVTLPLDRPPYQALAAYCQRRMG